MTKAFRRTAEGQAVLGDGAPQAAGRAAGEGRGSNVVDLRLAEAIVQRDESALAEAYSRHGSQVHAIARGLCGATRAEDLTQEIFLQLWNNPQRFDADRGSLRSYLLVQAHRRAVDILRSDNARSARESAQARRGNAVQHGTEEIALALLERQELQDLLAALPANERHPIVLAYFGGHAYRDVARLLAVPEGTVKSRIRSGLKRLRVEGGLQRDEDECPPQAGRFATNHGPA